MRRAVRKGGLREYRRVQVQLTQQEIREGLRAHPNTPQLLKEWLDKEALHSAVDVVDIS